MSSRKYTKEVLQEAADNSESYAGMLRYLGLKQAGGTQSHIAKMTNKLSVETSHFTGQSHNKGKISTRRKTVDQILIIKAEGSHRTKRDQLHRAMQESGIEYKCSCGLESKWNSLPITLEINHINGNNLDSRLSNLEYLCPNCHSQKVHTNMPHKYRN